MFSQNFKGIQLLFKKLGKMFLQQSFCQFLRFLRKASINVSRKLSPKLDFGGIQIC